MVEKIWGDTNQMEKNIKFLTDILQKETPVLFLGAGFSYGCKNVRGTLPTGAELAAEIYEKLLEENCEPEDRDEVKGFNLRQMCQAVSAADGGQKQLKEFLFERFSQVSPQSFHYYLLKYPWKRIYTVNIDDVVENVYRGSDQKLVVQNARVEKSGEGCDLEYIKLHGCVNAKEEPVVFSETEYTDLINKMNFKMSRLTSDIHDKSIIFIGASLDEPDIAYYVSLYESAGFMRKGRLVFIDPFPKAQLKMRIKKLDGVLIEWTTEQFLDFVKNLNYDPAGEDKAKKLLNYYGMTCYEDIKTCFREADEEIYESRLYEGYDCNWKDVFYEWVIDVRAVRELEDMISALSFHSVNAFCISIVGNCFTGKSCILKQLGAYLNSEGYDVIEYHGKTLNNKALLNYMESSSADRFALLVDNASFLYKKIEMLLQYKYIGKKLLIVTTSRNYYHAKKKYYLENNAYQEYLLTDKIFEEDAERIFKKLDEKGYLGEISRDIEQGKRQILQQKTYINLFTYLTYGYGFRRRVKKIADDIFDLSDDQTRSLFYHLVIFDKADLPYYPVELVTGHFYFDYNILMTKNFASLNNTQKVIADTVGFTSDGIILKNRLLIEAVWGRMSGQDKRTTITDILTWIAPSVSENDETYWRIIFESLLKEDRLVSQFHMEQKEVFALFYSVKNSFKQISYYWLQLGIAEQRYNDFTKALNHLNMAREIRPRAYQIQHAIARNYLKHANMEKDRTIAESLFQTGENRMLELINSRESYKQKAKYFSIHCYVYEKIRFWAKYPDLITKKSCRNLKHYIDMAISGKDEFADQLVLLFMNLLVKSNRVPLVNMELGDKYFKALQECAVKDVNMDIGVNTDTDVLVDSY